MYDETCTVKTHFCVSFLSLNSKIKCEMYTVKTHMWKPSIKCATTYSGHFSLTYVFYHPRNNTHHVTFKI